MNRNILNTWNAKGRLRRGTSVQGAGASLAHANGKVFDCPPTLREGRRILSKSAPSWSSRVRSIGHLKPINRKPTQKTSCNEDGQNDAEKDHERLAMAEESVQQR